VDRVPVFLTVGLLAIGVANACIALRLPPHAALKLAAVVFRGTVVTSKRLSLHPEMRGRQRYAVTMRVAESWKGNPSETVTLYDLAPGTDCRGVGLQPGKQYLIFASKEGASDYRLGPDLWYGWTDILPSGTPILQPLATVGGDLSNPEIRSEARQLGPGETPRE
jgi:hypothetical protein